VKCATRTRQKNEMRADSDWLVIGKKDDDTSTILKKVGFFKVAVPKAKWR